MFKQCIKCSEWKSIDEFLIRSDNGKARNECNKCRVARIRKWMDENRENVNKNQRAYNQTLNGRTFNLLNGAKARAEKKNQPFLITYQEVYNALEAGYCQKTLFPFDFTRNGKTWQSPFVPSIDKIDPNGIYEPSNVQYVCWWYNIAKQQWSEEIVLTMCKRMVGLYG